MTTKNIHILGIDPGGTTGYCRLTVPRDSIFGGAPSQIVDWDYGEITGPEEAQSLQIASLARTIQSLDYKCGPALLVEDWDIDPNFKSTDPETLSPVRIGAMLRLLMHQTHMVEMGRSRVGVAWFNDATLHFQGRTIAKSTATDERLKRWGLWVRGSTHIQDASRHAVVGLRRAAENLDFAEELWPH